MDNHQESWTIVKRIPITPKFIAKLLICGGLIYFVWGLMFEEESRRTARSDALRKEEYAAVLCPRFLNATIGEQAEKYHDLEWCRGFEKYAGSPIPESMKQAEAELHKRQLPWQDFDRISHEINAAPTVCPEYFNGGRERFATWCKNYPQYGREDTNPETKTARSADFDQLLADTAK